MQYLRQGPADMCAGLERVLYLRATYLQRGRQLLHRLGEHVLERLLRLGGICEFLHRGGGAIVDIPCPRCKLYLSGDGEGGFRAEEEHPVVVLRRQFAS